MEKNWGKIIDDSIAFLKKNKTILYPTDTIYGIGCDATNYNAVKKIYKIKQRKESKSLIILVNSFEMLQNHVENIPDKVKEYLKNASKPTTVIYKNPKNLPQNVIAQDNTVAIRMVKTGFVYDLVSKFNKPIVSTSANISTELTPKNFKSISQKIIKNVDFVVSLPLETKNIKPSSIIRFIDNKIVFLRD